MSSSSSSLLSSRESGGGQGSSSNNNRLKMNFVDVVAAATAAGDGGVENLSDADVSGSGEVRRRRNGGGGVGSQEEEESNHGEHDATIINNAGHKKSVIPVPPPMPVPPAFFEIERPIVQSIREFSNNNVNSKRTENLNWCKLWPPPEAVKMSSEQAKARHLVLNEIKELQLRRQTSFKRILKLPIWGSGKN